MTDDATDDGGVEQEERPEPLPAEPSLAGDFEKRIVDCEPHVLEGVWAGFQSKNHAIAGEILEVYDDPQGIRHILIQLDGRGGVVKAIPLWFLDGIWEGFDAD